MPATAVTLRLFCLVSIAALAAVATPALDTSRLADDGICAAAPSHEGAGDACGSPDHPDNQPAFENLFSGVRRGDLDKVRSVNSSSFFTHHILRTVQRLTPGGTSQSQDLALWMFVEFLKAAPLFMGMGCIMTIFVALRQKWSDLADVKSSVKIRWTKPATC